MVLWKAHYKWQVQQIHNNLNKQLTPLRYQDIPEDLYNLGYLMVLYYQ